MKKVLLLVGGIFGVTLAAYLLLWPVGIDPLPFEPPEPPVMVGVLEPNEELRNARRIAEGQLNGPEDVEVDDEGHMYAGTSDGLIVRIDRDSKAVTTFAETGGRPLGIMFDQDKNLIVCDAYKGLLSIDRDGQIEVLVREADGVPLGITNDLDIASDGTIYFTDASQHFSLDQHLYDLLEARPHGRLLRYRPDTAEVEVLADGFYFSNGVALSEDETFVLIAETYRYRLQRYWIDGEKAGTMEVVNDNLPGFPDNLNRSTSGGFWLAIYSTRDATADRLHTSPFAKRVLARLPKFLWPEPKPYGFVIELDAGGEILRTLQDPGGKVLREVTSAKERDGALYLGTLKKSWIGLYRFEDSYHGD